MQTENANTSESLSKSRNVKSLEECYYLNLPDLQFFKWCNRQYGLNKGVFNTIDNWFYGLGIVNILYRRIYILSFLEYAKDVGLKEDDSKFIRFGIGGLIRKLNEFLKAFQKVEEESLPHQNQRVN